VRRPEAEEFYETIGGGGQPNGFGQLVPHTAGHAHSAQIDGFASAAGPATSERPLPTTTTDAYGSRLAGGGGARREPPPAAESGAWPEGAGPRDSQPAGSSQPAQQTNRAPQSSPSQPQAQFQPQAQSQPQQQQPQQQQQQPVVVPVTYVTTLTYLTTVLHGTHTLETSHEQVERSTKLATLNAQLMDQIEHRLPLIEPTATLALSSRTKGRGTTMVNLKSAVSAYNQELVEALGQPGLQPTSLPSVPPAPAEPQQASAATSGEQSAPEVEPQQVQQVAVSRQGRPSSVAAVGRVRPSRTVDLRELQEARKQLLTEYVYSFTMRPQDNEQTGPGERAAASVLRSELVRGPPLDAGQLMNELAARMASGQPEQQVAGRPQLGLIDSNGLLRVGGNAPDDSLSSALGANQINLGK